jgi:flagellar protein FlaG
MKVLSTFFANGPVFETATPVKPTGLGSDATAGPSSSEEKSPAATVTAPVATTSVAGREELRAQKLPHLVINGAGIGIQFEIDDATGTTIIRQVDLRTGEVVRQIPPEEALNYLRQFESVKGSFLSRML